MIQKLSKKTIIIIVIVVLLICVGIGGYFGWKNSKKSKGMETLEKAGQAADAITDSVLKGVLPLLTTNPLENKPDINPADKANPFSDIKTNPFE